jgi:hypothetical protein
MRCGSLLKGAYSRQSANPPRLPWVVALVTTFLQMRGKRSRETTSEVRQSALSRVSLSLAQDYIQVRTNTP